MCRVQKCCSKKSRHLLVNPLPLTCFVAMNFEFPFLFVTLLHSTLKTKKKPAFNQSFRIKFCFDSLQCAFHSLPGKCFFRNQIFFLIKTVFTFEIGKLFEVVHMLAHIASKERSQVDNCERKATDEARRVLFTLLLAI